MTPASGAARSVNPAVTTNSDAAWHDFDPEAYFQHYYGEPHADDDALTFLAARALRSAGTSGAALDVVDVGTGPSLIPLLAALPVASRLTAWEYAEPNLTWLANEMAATQLRPQWQHFWRTVRTVYSEPGPRNEAVVPHDPLPSHASRTALQRGSIFDLPRRRFDAATMFFCAESITASPAEFQIALSEFVSSVRPGGLIAAAFLAGSSGYDVSGRRFPAVAIGVDDIAMALNARVSNLQIVPIGLSRTEIRSGYSGALSVTGRVAN